MVASLSRAYKVPRSLSSATLALTSLLDASDVSHTAANTKKGSDSLHHAALNACISKQGVLQQQVGEHRGCELVVRFLHARHCFGCNGQREARCHSPSAGCVHIVIHIMLHQQLLCFMQTGCHSNFLREDNAVVDIVA